MPGRIRQTVGHTFIAALLKVVLIKKKYLEY